MKFLLLVFLLPCCISAAPVKLKRQAATNSCGGQCSAQHTKFNFEIGSSYRYNWHTESELRTVGSNYGDTQVIQKATVTITPESDCQLNIKLSDVEISGLAVDSKWKEDLERSSLRFHFDDGVISSICPQPSEQTWVINIKRSILSALQNSHTTSQMRMDIYEWDVSGKCPTTYYAKSSAGTKTYERVKKLNNCFSPRETWKGVNYEMNSDYQSMALNATQTCNQVAENDIYKEISCTEQYDYVSVSQSSEHFGVRTKNLVKLTFKDKVAAVSDSSAIGPSRELHFEPTTFDFEPVQGAANLARDTLASLCSTEDIRPPQAHLFTSLVHSLRKMTETEITDLVESLSSACELKNKFIQDAIPVCSSQQCIKYMVKVLKSNELAQTTKSEWFSALAFVKKPTSLMIAEIETLVDDQHTQGLLGISSLVHNYCKLHSNCMDNQNIQNIIGKLRTKLLIRCQQTTDKSAVHKLLAVIKAIGNIGVDHTLVDSGKHCYESTKNVEIRLALLNALRRMPCFKVRSTGLEEIFENQVENLELRIESFTQRARCYSNDFKNSLERTYAAETSKDFANFMYTYVMAKRSNRDPTRAEETQFFRTIELEKRFSIDVTASSLYADLGRFDHTRNMGVQAQKSVIFTDSNMLPTSAVANLTLQYLGVSWNLLEVGIRQEGLDKLFNDLFGLEGYYTNAEAWESSKKKKMLENYKLKVSSYLRIFGNELAYGGFEENDQPTKKIVSLASMKDIWDKLAKGYETKINKNILFIDTEHQVPTLSGLPLVLAINGSASVKVKRTGKLDVTKSHEVHFKSSTSPSASVEISTMVGFEAGKARTGVKHVSRFHKSTSVDSSLEYKDRKLKAGVSLPKENMELFDIQSDHFKLISPTVFGGNRGTKQKSCLGIGRVLGIDFCAESTKPRTRDVEPMGVAITMEKTDKKLSSYELEIEVDKHGFPKRFLFDTPGSEVGREVRFQWTTNPDHNIRMELRTPVKELLAEGGISSTNEGNHNASMKVTIDNRDEYSATATLTAIIDPTGAQQLKPYSQAYGYDLTLQTMGPGLTPIRVTSHLESQINEGNGMLSPYFTLWSMFPFTLTEPGPIVWDTTITGLYDSPVEFKWLDDQEDYSTTISWTTPNYKGSHKTKLKDPSIIRDGLEFGVKTSYKNLKTSKITFMDFSLTQTFAQDVDLFELNQTHHFEASFAPQSTTDGKMAIKYTKENYSLNYEHTRGKEELNFFWAFNKPDSFLMSTLDLNGEIVYHLVLGVLEDLAGKYHLTAVCNSNLYDTQHALKAAYEPNNPDFIADVQLKSRGKQLVNVSLILPRGYNWQGNRVLVSATWNINDGVEKEITLNYRDEMSKNKIEFGLHLTSKLSAETYDFENKLHIYPEILFNSSFSKNKVKVMNSGLTMQYVSSKDVQAAASFQTFSPWPVRHYTGDVVFRNKQERVKDKNKFFTVDFLSRIELKCHRNNNRILLEVRHEKPDEANRTTVANFEFGTYKLCNSNRYARLTGEGTTHKWDEDYLIQWSRTKKIEFIGRTLLTIEWWFTIKELAFHHDIKTPFKSIRHLIYGIEKQKPEYEGTGSQSITKSYIEHNSVNIFDANMISIFERHNDFMVQMNFTTASDKLQEGNFFCKYFDTSKRQLQLHFEWNKDNRLGGEYEHEWPENGEKRRLYFIAKAPSHNWDSHAQLETEYDKSLQTVNAAFEMNVMEDNYEISVDFDGIAETGQAQINTPYDMLKDIQLEITKIAPSKYEFTSIQNGQQGLQMVGQLSLADDEPKLRIETQNTEKPFALVVEKTDKIGGRKLGLKLQLIEAPNSDSEKIWGIDYMSNGERGKDSGHLRLRAGNRYYERESQSVDEDIDLTIRVHPSDDVDIAPTELTVKTRMDRDPPYVGHEQRYHNEIEISLEDHNLQKPITLTVTVTGNEGGCGSRCTTFAMAKLDYTGKAADTVFGNLEYEMYTKDGAEWQGAHEMAVVLELEQTSTKFYEKLIVKRFVDNGTQEYSVARSFNDDDGIKQYMEFEFELVDNATSGKRFDSLIRTPDHTYKTNGHFGAEEGRGFEFFIRTIHDNVDLFNMGLARSGDGLINGHFEILQPQKADVLVHTSIQSLDKHQITISVWHTEKGKRIQDLQATITLTHGNRITTKLYCRPGLLREIEFGFEKGLLELEEIAGKEADSIAEGMPQFITALDQKVQPIFDSWAAEQKALSADSATLQKLEEQLWEYGEIANETMHAAADATEDAWDNLVEAIREQKLYETLDVVEEKIEELEEELSDIMDPAKEYWENIIEAVEESASDIGVGAKGFFNLKVIKGLLGDTEKAYNKILESDRVKEIEEWLDQTGLKDINMEKLENIIRGTLSSVWNYAAEYLPKLKENNPEDGRYEAVVGVPYNADSLEDVVRKIVKWARSFEAFKADLKEMVGYHYIEMLFDS